MQTASSLSTSSLLSYEFSYEKKCHGGDEIIHRTSFGVDENTSYTLHDTDNQLENKINYLTHENECSRRDRFDENEIQQLKNPSVAVSFDDKDNNYVRRAENHNDETVNYVNHVEVNSVKAKLNVDGNNCFIEDDDYDNKEDVYINLYDVYEMDDVEYSKLDTESQETHLTSYDKNDTHK